MGIIDDASNDGSAQWIQQLHLSQPFHCIYHQSNRGRSATRNDGLKIAIGDIIIFLDGDMSVMPDFVQQHIDALIQEGIVAVAGRVEVDKNIKKNKVLKYLFDYKGRGAKQFSENSPMSFQYLTTQNMSMNSKVLQKVGLMDENIPNHRGEDIAYAYKIWQAFPSGLRYSAQPKAIFSENYSITELLKNYSQFGKNALPVILNNYPGISLHLFNKWVSNSILKKWFGIFFFNNVGLYFGKLLFILCPYPLSNYVIRYTLACAVISNWRRSCN